MRLGIIGLPGAGKSTVFDALTGQTSDPGAKSEHRIGAIPVPDDRVDILSDMYQPTKTIHAKVEYFLPGIGSQKSDRSSCSMWTPVRDCDALIHVARNFGGYAQEPPTPVQDCTNLDQDMIINDLVSVEKRLERLGQDR